MKYLLSREKNPNELLNINEAPQITTSLEERITALKNLIDKTIQETPEEISSGKITADLADLRLRCYQDSLKDLYDTKYIGQPVHKQQLSIFENNELELSKLKAFSQSLNDSGLL